MCRRLFYGKFKGKSESSANGSGFGIAGPPRISLRWKFNMWCCWVFEVGKKDAWVWRYEVRRGKAKREKARCLR